MSTQCCSSSSFFLPVRVELLCGVPLSEMIREIKFFFAKSFLKLKIFLNFLIKIKDVITTRYSKYS